METSNTFIGAYDALPLALRQLQSAALRRDSGHVWSARAGVAVCKAQAVGAVEALVAVAAGGVVGQHGSVLPLACNNNAGKLALLRADKHVLAINLPIQKTVPIALVFLGVVGLVGKPGAVAVNHEIAVQGVKLFDGFYDLKGHDLCGLGSGCEFGQLLLPTLHSVEVVNQRLDCLNAGVLACGVVSKFSGQCFCNARLVCYQLPACGANFTQFAFEVFDD